MLLLWNGQVYKNVSNTTQSDCETVARSCQAALLLRPSCLIERLTVIVRATVARAALTFLAPARRVLDWRNGVQGYYQARLAQKVKRTPTAAGSWAVMSDGRAMRCESAQ